MFQFRGSTRTEPGDMEAILVGKNRKGHAQHIAFVLKFGKFCRMN
jgi:hypothetical protein